MSPGQAAPRSHYACVNELPVTPRHLIRRIPRVNLNSDAGDHQAGRRLQRVKATEAADPASAWRSGKLRRRSKAGSMAPAHGPNQLAMPDAIGDARRPRIY